jgi:hypothetical protein
MPAVSGDAGIEDASAILLEPLERARLVGLHEARAAAMM